MSFFKGHVLLVSDDAGLASGVTAAADLAACRSVVVADMESAHEMIGKRQFDLILLDAGLLNGQAAKSITALDVPWQARIVVAGHAPAGTDREVANDPSFERLVDPVSLDALTKLFDSIRLRTPSQEIQPDADFSGMIGRTRSMQALFENIRRVARLSVSVLLQGESGTGKELVTRALHQLSGRTGKFVAVNCGAVTPELLSSQMFGHERGSFTGATQTHAGYFEQAQHGTLFLDEISEMPIALQTYLLRALDTHSVTRVGGSREIPFDVRVVAASNRDLRYAIVAGSLRSDLYYRLLEFPIRVPPLRERRDDIPLLAQHVLDQLNERYATRKRLSDGAQRELNEHYWPGNVRELLYTVQRSYILSDEADEIELRYELPPMERRNSASQANLARDANRDTGFSPEAWGNDAIHVSVGTNLEKAERELILKTLTHFSKQEAARVLGISLKTLYNKLQQYRSQGLISDERLDDPPQER